LVWLWAILRFYAAVAVEKLAGRDTLARRAVRLRMIFEDLGPTFIKIGQQLSARADLLPLEYCQEFALMLDAAPPFPTEKAEAIIERAIGAAVADVFEDFDRAPIGSGSLACVYKARLHGGPIVAVKVRRPGVVIQLAADMRVLDWVLRLGEVLNLFRPGYTFALRTEVSWMLFEELDFLREARNTELFRAEALRANRHYIKAPRVYFELCAEDVIVTEFVTGVFLKDILAALDRGDEAELQRIRDTGIDLREVARRLVLSAHWEFLESLLFHSDPHPANICVQPGNVLMFLDFGSCGRLTGKYRRIWRRFYLALTAHNVQDMVQTAIAILEPLPPIDVERFTHEIELMFWDWVYAMQSDHSAWWEKASGMLWMNFTAAARRYQAPMSFEVVRIFRTTLIYDTIIFRLWEKLDMRDEFRQYQHQAGRRAKRRIRRKFWRRVEHGFTDRDYTKIDNLLHMGKQAVGRMQHFLDTPMPDFARDIGKLSYAVNLVLRLVALGLAAYIGAFVVIGTYSLAVGRQIDVFSLLSGVVGSGWYHIAVAAIAFLLIRKAISKFEEPEPDD
jgi:predicted unusual protein kinase regulating ubiquinone biosynthesis (AarF/ABC1/UbiB family)